MLTSSADLAIRPLLLELAACPVVSVKGTTGHPFPAENATSATPEWASGDGRMDVFCRSTVWIWLTGNTRTHGCCVGSTCSSAHARDHPSASTRLSLLFGPYIPRMQCLYAQPAQWWVSTPTTRCLPPATPPPLVRPNRCPLGGSSPIFRLEVGNTLFAPAESVLMTMIAHLIPCHVAYSAC